MTMVLMPRTLLRKVNLPPPSNEHARIPYYRVRGLLALGSMELKRYRFPPLRLLLAFLHDNDLSLVLPGLRRANNDDLLHAHLLHGFKVFFALDSTLVGVEVGGSKDLTGAIEGEAAVDKGAHFIVEGLAVVHVQGSCSISVLVECDNEGEGVVFHKTRGSTRAVTAWDDMTSLHKQWNLLEGSWNSVVSCTAVSGEVEVVIVGLVVRNVDRDTVGALLGNWLGKETGGTNVELVVDFKTTFIVRVYPEVGPDNGCASSVSLVESSVPGREELVSKTQSLSNNLGVGRAGNIWLTATSVDVSMAAEEGVVNASLIPASQKFLARVTEEASNVCAAEGEARDTLVEHHRDGSLEMGPLSLIVASPHGSSTLTARVEGSSKNEGATNLSLLALGDGLVGRVVEGHAVDVVNVAMFPVTMVKVILGHSCFRAVEHRGLVHVVPDEGVVGGTLELVVVEQALPPVDGSWVKAVDPHGRTRPAPTLVLVTIFVLDSQVLLLQLVNDGVIVSVLNVRINDSNKFPVALVKLLLHCVGIGKGQRIPGEVLLLLCVLNVEPDDIVRNVELIKPPVNVFDILIGNVVPSTLVVGDSERLRHGRVASQLTILASEILRSRSKKDEHVQETTLGHPVSLSIGMTFNTKSEWVGGVPLLGDVDPSLCTVEPKDTDGGAFAVGLHERNGAVEGHGAVHLVLEDVSVVQSVWLSVSIVAAPGFC